LLFVHTRWRQRDKTNPEKHRKLEISANDVGSTTAKLESSVIFEAISRPMASREWEGAHSVK